MSAALSTHVLDLASGAPAVGLGVSVHQGSELILATQTNADGRCPDLLGGRRLHAGGYRLVFAVGPYYAARQVETFFGSVPIDFQITDASRHHHVPLLLSPFGYSTYRGS